MKFQKNQQVWARILSWKDVWVPGVVQTVNDWTCLVKTENMGLQLVNNLDILTEEQYAAKILTR